MPKKLTCLLILLSGLLSCRQAESQGASEEALYYVSGKAGNWDIWRSNQDGTNPRRLTTYQGPDYNPTISPDGEKIAFTTYRWGGHRIGIMNADGSDAAMMLPRSRGYNLAPNWSPDGKEIAFFMVDKGYWQIFKYHLETKRLTDLTSINTTSERSPSWSPDGQKIAFQSVRDGNWEIYVMDKDGGNQRRLTSAEEDDFMPSWSPDGKQIVFGSGRNGQLDVFIMNADGSDQRNLTNGRPMLQKPNRESHKDDLSPVFSADGQYIFWSAGASGTKADIYRMRTDGTGLTKIIGNLADDRFPVVKK